MMIIWDSQSLKNALQIAVPDDICVGGVQFNSQEIRENDLFIALPGKRDGHEFAADAINRGASAVIVSKNIPEIDDNKQIIVADTMHALKALAEYKRRNSKAKFIGITGSVGKTSTRKALEMMLGAYGKTHASIKSYNNFLGVPLTLASMPDDVEYAIIEMGMSAHGEIRELTNIAIPDIAVVTVVSEGHIESFDSLESIADAKCEIFEGIDINAGIAIINRDMSTYEKCIENIDSMGIRNVQTFGQRVDANVRFLSYELLDDLSVRLQFGINSEEMEIVMPNIPEHLASNFAICFSVISSLGLDVDKAADVIRDFQPLMGRGKFVKVRNNNKNLGIICDYYNANPQSMRAALDYLQSLSGDNKVAVLGDMGELGDMQLSMHKSIVPNIINAGVSRLFLVGKSMKQIKNDFPREIKVTCYEDVDKLILDNDKNFIDEDLLLIKGSRFMSLEKLAKSLGVENVL